MGFVVILRPNLPVKPLTLFVNKAPMADEQHGNLTWGAAQAGIASSIAEHGRRRRDQHSQKPRYPLLIAASLVNPATRHPALVTEQPARHQERPGK